ncbi:pentatricopeptide repeat-containing protein At2g13600-like [Telopea speciosissima]|uniref:pentatricopeptide repeat-containing protein At2g13600-like n=1 Tax=Telopea speciosissima TaxID=54955 RepID=UPI001CC7E9E0|nr:pentatricopeptide repeat-containing protein At2g13600-like [Telopea speciosissima]
MLIRRTFCSWGQQQSLAEKLWALSMEGRLDEVIRILRQTPDSARQLLTSETYLPLIRCCIKFKAFAQGREIHKHIVDSGIRPDVVILNNLMMLYSKCGNLEVTRQVFEGMAERNLFSWTAMIGAYSNSGYSLKAFKSYEQMILAGFRADHFLYPLVLKSCSGMKALGRGQRVHADIIRSGFQWDLVVMNSLVDMYAKCGNVGDAKRTFDEMAVRDIFAWTSMIVGYTQMGHGLQALELFKGMMLSGVKPCSATLAGILPIFSDLGSLELSKQIHGLVIISGFEYEKFVGTSLIDMYANCGGLGYGRLIFDRVKDKDVVCWNTMIKGYAQVDLFDEVLELLRWMDKDGKIPNKTTWDCIISHFLQRGQPVEVLFSLVNQLEQNGMMLNVMSLTLLDQLCEQVEDIKQVNELHGHLSRDGYILGSIVASCLIRMYSKCGDLEAAQEVFDCIRSKELDCWNSIIACFAYNGYANKALELFDSMRKNCMKPNVHSWNTVIAGFIDVGDFETALETFTSMKWSNQKPNPTSFDIILPVIGSSSCSVIGKQLHCMFLRNDCEMSRFVCTAFINMYGNCRNVDYAINLFESIDDKDLVSWNAIISALAKNGYLNEASRTFHEMKMAGVSANIITWTALVSGYAQNGEVDESFKHFCELQLEGLKPNSITIASILPACAQSATLSHGKSIHCYIIRSGLHYDDLFIANALIDMFVKCGCMEYAERVFRILHWKDVVSWNTMIQGFSVHGKAESALTLFSQMLADRVDPDGVTFVGVLSACSHAGLVEEGWKHFNSMNASYGIVPSGKHYACMVDLLGRKGHFEDVRNFILQMPLQPTASLWGALLSACKTHGNVEMAEYAMDHLIELQPQNPGNYVILSNIYANAGRWNDVDHVRKLMVDHGVRKLPGCSWIEIGSSIHAFTVENTWNEDMNQEINKMLLDLAAVMIEERFVPQINTIGFT